MTKLITPSTPYLFIEIWTPKLAPYNDDAIGWPCIVGDFCKPIAEELPAALVWWVREGPWFQLCIAWHDRARAEEIVKSVAKRRGFKIKRILPGVAGGGLAGTRWLAAANIGKAREGERSILMLRTMNAICRLYADTLVLAPLPSNRRGVAGKPARWYTELNADPRQNAHGQLFESLMHLIANSTGAQFTIHLMARTSWMDWAPTQVTANL
jgi:hypothetical protein